MPRIAAPTIAEHVAAQESSILDAARRLFAERDFASVTLADIAREVGLSRTSLYRYVRTKAELVQRWFDQEMDPLVAASEEVAGRDTPARDRLAAWLDLQLDFALDEAHTTLAQIGTAPGALPDEVVAHIGKRHMDLYATLAAIRDDGTAAAPVSADVQRVRVRLVAGLISSSAELVRHGVPEADVRAELRRAGSLLLDLAD